MPAESMGVRSWRVGRYTVTLSLPKIRPGALVGAVVEWDPAVPARLSSQEAAQYKEGLAAAIREMTAASGEG